MFRRYINTLLLLFQQYTDIVQGTWTQYGVKPLIGAGIANFGSQVITTTMTTFAVDNYRERSGDVGIAVNVVRQIWAFVSYSAFNLNRYLTNMPLQIGPFYFPDLYGSLGFAGGSGLLVGLIFVFAVIPVAIVHFRGRERKTVEDAA